jgi:hypothetical protein
MSPFFLKVSRLSMCPLFSCLSLATGDVLRVRGQRAGRWRTAVSVLGDLHEVARIVDGAV